MGDSRGNLPGRLRRLVRGRTPGWWPIFGSLLASSAVPCPECGAPLALHIWPLLLLLVMVRALTGRRITAVPQGEANGHAGQHCGQASQPE
jgi:hypothetical protein